MARPISDRWRAFVQSETASLAVMSATLFPLVIGCAALAIDLGTIFADRRHAQSAADIAAVVAASNLSVASSAATSAAVQNRFPASAVTTVELGTYTANALVAPQARFVAGGSPGANAARVTMTTATPLYFSRFFTGSDRLELRSTATATHSAIASFAIGSRTVGLNNGVLNALLGQMLGADLSLSLSDYDALLNARVDIPTFWSELATRLNVSAVTYDSLLSGSAKVGDLVVALQKANGSSGVTNVLNSLVATLGALTTATPLSSIASLGPYSSLLVGQKPQTSAAASAFDLLSAIAQAANGINQLSTSLTLGLPGIASAAINIAIGERPRGVNAVAVGPVGASAQTAQTRMQVTLQLLGTPAVPLVSLPIYLEVARGTATLNRVHCGYPSTSTSSVGMAVTPGIVDGWIGVVSTAQLHNFASAPNPAAGVLVNLPPVTMTGRAHAMMGNTSPIQVTFSSSDIQNQTKKTATTTNFTSSLTASLLGDLALNANVGPLGLPIPGLGSAVAGIIAGAAASIDQLLGSLLAALGVGIGQADVWVNGVRCDRAVLVN